jgi:hypothetical protein
MNEKKLDAKIDRAPAEKIRQCLKYIVGAWFVERNGKNSTVNFNKELNSDTLEEVTTILHTFGFCPPEKE